MRQNILALITLLTATLTLSSVARANEHTDRQAITNRHQAINQVLTIQSTKEVTKSLKLTDSEIKSKLVGIWKASIFEYGQRIEVSLTINPNGFLYASFAYPNGNILTKTSRWEYSGNLLTEITTDGELAKGSIEFVNSNYFVLTILTNSDPGSAGIKRHYYRDPP